MSNPNFNNINNYNLQKINYNNENEKNNIVSNNIQNNIGLNQSKKLFIHNFNESQLKFQNEKLHTNSRIIMSSDDEDQNISKNLNASYEKKNLQESVFNKKFVKPEYISEKSILKNNRILHTKYSNQKDSCKKQRLATYYNLL